jgi:hypothetical protein
MRLFFLIAGLLMASQLAAEPAHSALLQASSVTVSMSNPSCTQSRPTSGTCSLQFFTLTASGSDPSFSRLEVLVGGKLRLYMGGFFEPTAFYFHTMLPGGLKVTCGRPNASGSPGYGKAYLITVNAYMADGSSATKSMNVYCPAFEAKAYLPLIRK